MKERVLVTGATGFVGSNLVRQLIKEEYEVHILTRNNSNCWRIKDIFGLLNNHCIELLNRKELEETVKKINPDKICHLAVYGGYPFQKEDKKIIETNFEGTVNLVDALQNIDYRCFINTGSSSEYGKKATAMKESDLCEPNTIYGVAKAAATMYCNCIAQNENKNMVTLRLFSVYGNYEEEGRLITSLFTSMLSGQDVRLGNPNAVRDFVYVGDVVEAFLKVLKHEKRPLKNIYNICTGVQNCVGDVAELTKDLLNSSNSLIFGKNQIRSYDTNSWVGDNSLFKNEFDWNPLDIREGIRQTMGWFKENINLYRK